MTTEKFEDLAGKINGIGLVLERVLETLTKQQAAHVAAELKTDLQAAENSSFGNSPEYLMAIKYQLSSFQQAADNIANGH